jgi:putative ABC transport system permease protein
MIKNPALTLVVALTIAIGVGPTTAIFSIVNTVLLRPLPYEDAEQIMTVWGTNPRQGQNQMRTSIPNFKDWRQQSQLFDSMAAYYYNRYNITGAGEPEQARAGVVSEDFFKVMGVQAAVGRTFTAEENAQPFVVLGDALWKRRFNADPNVIWKSITLNGKNYTVTGVMPASFEFPSKEAAFWTTMGNAMSGAPEQASSRGFRSFYVVGRMKPGVRVEKAQTEMNIIASRLQQQYPDTNTGLGINIIPLREQMVGNIKPALLALFGAVAFVLLIACSNVASLLLARAVVRDREFAIRMALGANRARLISQSLTESMLLALVGGGAGLLMALLGVKAFSVVRLDAIPQLGDVRVDGWVLLFTLAATLFSGMIFGLTPALQTKVNLSDALKESSRGSVGSARSLRLRGLLVISEIAFSIVLLIGAGLMVKSFLGLLRINPGFNPNNLLTMQLVLPGFQYKDGPAITAFYQQVSAKIKALPGVQSVGACSGLPPVFNQQRNGFAIEGYQPSGPQEKLVANYLPINSEYFRTLGVPFITGREFTDRDAVDTARVVIINQRMAQRYFPNGDVIGRRLDLGFESQPRWRTIVGVVGDLKYSGSLYAEEEDAIYVPYLQEPYGGMYIMVRANDNIMGLMGGIRNTVWSLDKSLPITRVRVMEQVLSESVAQPRFYMLLFSIFAAIALILASIGIYGMISYSVAQRTHELGIRIALGAGTKDVFKLILRQGFMTAAIGAAIGIFIALGVTKFISGLLYGVSAIDATTFILIPLLLITVALVASFIPAYRATRVDPMTTLRNI